MRVRPAIRRRAPTRSWRRRSARSKRRTSAPTRHAHAGGAGGRPLSASRTRCSTASSAGSRPIPCARSSTAGSARPRSCSATTRTPSTTARSSTRPARYRIRGNVHGACYTSFSVETGAHGGPSLEGRGLDPERQRVRDRRRRQPTRSSPARSRSRATGCGSSPAQAASRPATTGSGTRSVAADPTFHVPLSIEPFERPGPAPPMDDAAIAAGIRRVINFVRGATLDFPGSAARGDARLGVERDQSLRQLAPTTRATPRSATPPRTTPTCRPATSSVPTRRW